MEESIKKKKINGFYIFLTISFLISLSILIYIISYLNDYQSIDFYGNINTGIEYIGNEIGYNLGKTLSLLGFIGTFIIYSMTHKGYVLMIGIITSLIAGGLVGISSTFFNAGQAAFVM